MVLLLGSGWPRREELKVRVIDVKVYNVAWSSLSLRSVRI